MAPPAAPPAAPTVTRFTPPDRMKLLAFACLLAIATLVAYSRVGGCEFLNYDDQDYITDNRMVTAGLTLRGIVWAFTTDHSGNWHPLTWLSHMLDCSLFGLNPAGHHWVSLLLHLASAILLLIVLARATRAPGPSAFVAGLFALHPLHVESVAWVAERKDVLSTLFLMLTLWSYVLYAERPTMTGRVRTLALFALGLMAKPMLVTLPFVLLLLDVWPLGRLTLPARGLGGLPGGKGTGSGAGDPAGGGDGPEALRSADGSASGAKSVRESPPRTTLAALVAEKTPFFVLAAASSVITYIVQRRGAAVSSLDLVPLHYRAANALVSYAAYLGKMLWPSNLVAIYPHPGMSPVWQMALAVLALGAITVFVFAAPWRRPWLATGWLWYLGTLVPVIGLVQVGAQAMADRYTYVPLIGVFVMIAWGIPALLPEWRGRAATLGAVACATLVVLAALTWNQTAYWKNSLVLFRHTLAHTKNNGPAENNLGTALLRQGRADEAIGYFNHILRMKPDTPFAWMNLGVAFVQQGKLDEAVRAYNETLRLTPDSAQAHYGLGVALLKQGRYNEAGEHFAAVLKTSPDHMNARFNLGGVLLQEARWEEAASLFRSLIEVNPANASYHRSLGIALAGLGSRNEAVAQYSEALRLKPADPATLNDLAVNLAALGKVDEAIGDYRKSLGVDPNHVDSLINLARLLASHPDGRVRDGAEAVRLATRAVELTGRRQGAPLAVLAMGLAEQGRFDEALATSREALTQASAAGRASPGESIEKQIAVYEAGRPWRETPGADAAAGR